jgi:tRNA A37 threonylcarbamoyladenosine modification protein TsaB
MAAEKKRGQPKKFKSAAEMQKAIDAYYDSCYANVIVKDKNGAAVLDDAGKVIYEKELVEPLTITGLALALGTNRQTLLNYQNEYEADFFDTITRAKTIIENYAEKQLYLAKSANGPAFNLKNNYGWVDKQEIDTNASGSIEVVFSSDLEKWSK